MKAKQLNKSEFTAMLMSNGNENHQLVFENETWFEEVTIGGETFCHKLLALKKTSADLINRKALGAEPSIEPLRLKAKQNGPVVALVFNTHYSVYYHLLISSKSEMAEAKRLVIWFAKSLISKRNTCQPKESLTTFVA